MKRILLFFAILYPVLSGNTNNIRIDEEKVASQNVPHGKSLLYLYRPFTQKGISSYLIVTIDKTSLPELDAFEYFLCILDSGKYNVKGFAENEEIQVYAEPGKSYFIEVLPKGGLYGISCKIMLKSEDEGRRELEKCRPIGTADSESLKNNVKIERFAYAWKRTEAATELSTNIQDLDSIKYDKLTDPRDGQVYKTINIGNQWVMAQNLAYKPDSGKYWAYKGKTENIKEYGYLYDWETANRIAPEGWHLPAKEEWDLFITNYKMILFKDLFKGILIGDEKIRMALENRKDSLKQIIFKSEEAFMLLLGEKMTEVLRDKNGFNAWGGLRAKNGMYLYLDYNSSFWSSSLFDDPKSAWILSVWPYKKPKLLTSVRWSNYILSTYIENGLSVRLFKNKE